MCADTRDWGFYSADRSAKTFRVCSPVSAWTVLSVPKPVRGNTSSLRGNFLHFPSGLSRDLKAKACLRVYGKTRGVAHCVDVWADCRRGLVSAVECGAVRFRLSPLTLGVL